MVLGHFERQNFEMARPAGFEPTTPGFGGQYSIHLSYGRLFIGTNQTSSDRIGYLYDGEA